MADGMYMHVEVTRSADKTPRRGGGKERRHHVPRPRTKGYRLGERAGPSRRRRENVSAYEGILLVARYVQMAPLGPPTATWTPAGARCTHCHQPAEDNEHGVVLASTGIHWGRPRRVRRPNPEARSPKPEARRSTFDVRRSTFDVRRSRPWFSYHPAVQSAAQFIVSVALSLWVRATLRVHAHLPRPHRHDTNLVMNRTAATGLLTENERSWPLFLGSGLAYGRRHARCPAAPTRGAQSRVFGFVPT